MKEYNIGTYEPMLPKILWAANQKLLDELVKKAHPENLPPRQLGANNV